MMPAHAVLTNPNAAANCSRDRVATGRSRDKTPGSLFFLGALWFSLFFGVMVLLVLIVTTAIDGARPLRHRAAHQLLLRHQSRTRPASAPASSAPCG